MIDDRAKANFQTIVWNYYHGHGRHDLPWRQPESSGTFDPYKILVSEVMLQQTQVARVIPKYHRFLETFPDTKALAQAGLGEVLRVWSGLGYNRRAKFLWQAAQQINQNFAGEFPQTIEGLVTLPGVGINTAGAVAAYAFNSPTVFVETNIRTVIIHHFFQDKRGVGEGVIRQFVATTLPSQKPREWYWALMDYGAYLKREIGNLNMLSITYKKQSSFTGSRRQIRGQVLRSLQAAPLSLHELKKLIPDERLTEVVTTLVNEKMIKKVGKQYSL